MRLNKIMIKTFSKVAHGINTMEELAKALYKSTNRMTEVIKDLEDEGFVIKQANYTMKGSRKIVDIATTNHAVKLKELMFEYPTLKFEDLLSDSKLLYLAALSEDWIDTQNASGLSRISKYMIQRYRKSLKNRGVIIQKDILYKLNEKAWPHLKEFLIAYKNYSTIKGSIKWKYQDEVLFEVDNANLIQGSITGFAGYSAYGFKINTIKTICHLPKKDISKEEVFIHSLFEIEDPRTLHLALAFYLKNKLNYKKTSHLAMRYSKYTMFENMIKLLKVKEEKANLEGLPSFERKDLIRIAKIYGVKDV